MFTLATSHIVRSVEETLDEISFHNINIGNLKERRICLVNKLGPAIDNYTVISGVR